MKDLKGSVVVITGGSSGLGKAAAKRLGQSGAIVYILARTQSRLQETERELKAKGYSVISIKTDIASSMQVKQAIDRIIEEQGKIDYLINNAGIGYMGAVEEMDTKKYDEMFNTNMKGVFNMVRHVLPHMKERKSGYIINISSGAGLNGIPQMAVYCATKFALRGFSEALAQEAKPFNIRVSIINPGSINTPFHINFKGTEPDQKTKESMMQPEDIAETIHHMIIQPERYWIFDVTTRAFKKIK